MLKTKQAIKESDHQIFKKFNLWQAFYSTTKTDYDV